jgi:hypothetical protein
MQPRANIHQAISCPVSFQATGLLDDSTALDTSNGVFNDDSALTDILIEPSLKVGQGTISRFFKRHFYMNARWFVALKTRVLAKSTLSRILAIFFVSDPFVMNGAQVSST